MSSLPPPPPASILDAAVASPSLSTTILLALATALVLPLLLVALGVSVSALWKAVKAELAPVQAPAPRRKKSSKPPRAATATAAAAEAPPPPSAKHVPLLEPEQQKPTAIHPAQAVMRALNDPTLQVRVSGLLTRNPPGGGALFRGELMDGSAVAVFAARRPMVGEQGGASTSAAASNSSSSTPFSIPPLLGAGAAHPNVAQLFAVRETIVPGGCNAASGALLPPARRGCWGGNASGSVLALNTSDGRPLSLAAALAAAGAPLPDSSSPSSSSSSTPIPEIETVAIYEFCERGTLRDAIRAWAATAAAAKSRLGGGGGGAAAASSASCASSPSRLTPFDPSISPAPPPDDAHLRVKTLLEVARGLARVHRAGGRPHGALCAENVVLAASDADRRGFVAKLAAFSRPPSAGVGAGVGAWGAAPPGLAPELVELARGGGIGGGGVTTMSASELRRRRRLASTSSAEDIDEEVEFSAPLPPWAAPLGPPAGATAAETGSSPSLVAPPPAATFEADVYAFGVLAWEVAASADAGLLPPPLPTAATATAAAPGAPSSEALLASWPCCRALGSLATQCLSPQPRARPSVAQLLRSLAALEERLRADPARSELDYLFAAVNARQAPVSSSSAAPAFEPRVVRAAAPVAAAVAAAAAAAADAAAPSSSGKKGGEIEGAEEEGGQGGQGGAAAAAARSAPRPTAAAAAAAAGLLPSSSSARPFTEDIFFGMPSPPM